MACVEGVFELRSQAKRCFVMHMNPKFAKRCELEQVDVSIFGNEYRGIHANGLAYPVVDNH